MKTKVYSFISAKGGSGKTILTATLAEFISQLGKKVLMIDADGSTNGLSLFYLNDLLSKRKEQKIVLLGIFENKYSYSQNNHIILDNGVHFIPATYQFNNTDCFDSSTFQNHLTETVENIKKETEFDYILIDCQAGSDFHTEVVIDSTISNEVIIVSEYDPISAAGVERIKGLFYKHLAYERTWVLLNKVLPEFAEINDDFLEISKYLPPILWDAEVVRKYARKEIALDFNNGNEYTLSIIKLIRILFEKNLKEDLTNWLNEKDEIIKKPIYEEYQKIKVQLDNYEEKERSILKSWMISVFISFSATLSIALLLLLVIFVRKNYDPSVTTIINKFGSIIYFMIGMFFVFSIYTAYRFITRRKQLYKENKYEKEILRKRIQELELLKHSSIEKILRKNRRIENTI